MLTEERRMQLSDVLRPASPPREIDNVYTEEQRRRLLDVVHDNGPWKLIIAQHFASAKGIFNAFTRASGWVPIVAAMLGPCFAGPTNHAALADYVVMVRGIATMGMAGPALVKAGTGEDIDKEALGGATLQVDETGAADLAVDSEDECFAAIRRYLSYLPDNARAAPRRSLPSPLAAFQGPAASRPRGRSGGNSGPSRRSSRCGRRRRSRRHRGGRSNKAHGRSPRRRGGWCPRCA